MPPEFLIASQIAVVSGLVIAFFLVVRLIQSSMLHRTLRKAIENDPAAAAGIMNRIERRPGGAGDGRNGLILLALGLALAGFGIILDDSDTRFLLGASLFPILVGAALMLRARFAARTTPE